MTSKCMTDRKSYLLKPLIDEFVRAGNDQRLVEYLGRNSNLPGPRGNLELAAQFAKLAAEYEGIAAARIWELCLQMTSVSAKDAPVNSPDEFIPFCGSVGMGAIAAVHSGHLEEALSRLRELAKDSRWRMREAVVMALQKLIAANPNVVIDELNVWLREGQMLELRAVAAAVAEPAILKNEEVAKAALRMNREVMQKLSRIKKRKSEDFRVLRKALGYTLSVVIVPMPKEGFEYMRQLLPMNDPDINWIVRENLKKNRLLKNFPTDVNSIKSLLD